MIDLHIHTINSDGSETVEEILKRAEAQKLSHISITDHESVNGHYQLRRINVKDYYSGKIIPGVELKNYYKDRVIDMLAYNIDIDKFNEYLEKNYKNKTHRILEEKNLKHFYKQAKGYGLVLNPIESLEWDKDRDWGSVVFYNELKKHPENKAKVPQDLWEDFFNFKKDYVYNRNNMFFLDKKDDYPSPSTTVEEVHKAGGIAFLAHVHEYKWIDDKIEYIRQFIKDSDIDGIECYYSKFTDEQTKELLEFCKENKLYTSGGSDFHGKRKPDIQIGIGKGNLQIPDDIIKDWYLKPSRKGGKYE